MKLGNFLGGLGGGLLLGALNSGKIGQNGGLGGILQSLFNPLGILGKWGGGKHPLIGGGQDEGAMQGLADPASAIPGAVDPSQYMRNVLGQLGGGQ